MIVLLLNGILVIYSGCWNVIERVVAEWLLFGAIIVSLMFFSFISVCCSVCRFFVLILLLLVSSTCSIGLGGYGSRLLVRIVAVWVA